MLWSKATGSILVTLLSFWMGLWEEAAALHQMRDSLFFSLAFVALAEFALRMLRGAHTGWTEAKECSSFLDRIHATGDYLQTVLVDRFLWYGTLGFTVWAFTMLQSGMAGTVYETPATVAQTSVVGVVFVWEIFDAWRWLKGTRKQALDFVSRILATVRFSKHATEGADVSAEDLESATPKT